MGFPQVIQLLTLLFASISVGLALYAVRSARVRLSESVIVNEVRKMHREIDDLTELFESLNTSMKRLRSKYAMRDKRSKEKLNGEVPNEQTTDAEKAAWKKQARADWHRGTFK